MGYRGNRIEGGRGNTQYSAQKLYLNENSLHSHESQPSLQQLHYVCKSEAIDRSVKERQQ